MKVKKSSVETLGNTPLVELSNYGRATEAKSAILAKVEAFNPAGSVKDRVAYAIIEDAVKSGRLKPGGTIIEATSGNTGIGLASLGTALGYRVVITMPETMSIERRLLIKAYGAELVLTEGALGMKGALARAEEILLSTENAIMAGQFTNPANPKAHYEHTGPELWEQAEGKIDILVAGVGTGGTISGVGAYLKEKNPHIKVVAVEPADSPVLSGGVAGPHKIQGIGAGFVPDTLNRAIYDEVKTVHTEEAYSAARLLGATEGFLVGISSGAALHVATELAKEAENINKRIVVILPDTGERYLTTPLYCE